MQFLHELSNASELFQVVSDKRQLLPVLVEKDYWLMHCLWGIATQGFQFELKGGTSLSKGFGIIERFSEDIDIQIYPSGSSVKTGKNNDKPSHVDGRKHFFDTLAQKLNIPAMSFYIRT